MTNNQVQPIKQRDITDVILSRVDEMKHDGLALPSNYNAANALNIAFLKLVDMKVRNQPLLEVVTKKSIQESLLNMVLQGLSPAKNQVYFIPYGNELQMQRSYFGTQTALKRMNGINDIWANVVFEGDNFDILIDEKGRERLKVHETSFLNRDNPIVAAYAIVETEENGQLLTVMTKKEIDKSWAQAKTNNVQKSFPQEMAKRTVINRAAKSIINSSDDSDMLVQAINQSTENEYDNNTDRHDVTPQASDKTQGLLSDFKPNNPIKQAEIVEEPNAVSSDPEVATGMNTTNAPKETEELENFFKEQDMSQSVGAEYEEVGLFDNGNVKSKLG